jgi:anti-anti-sigma factor
VPDTLTFGRGAPLRAHVDADGHILVVALSGELELTASAELVSRLFQMAGEGPDSVLLDMGEVVYLDSPGLEALVSARRGLEAMGKRLVVRHLAGQPRRVAQLEGVLALLERKPPAA